MNPTRPASSLAAPTALPVALLLSFAAALAAQQPGAAAADPARPGSRSPDALTSAFRSAQQLARTDKAPLLVFVLPPADVPADAAVVAATLAAEQRLGVLVTKGGAHAPEMRTARDVMLRQLQLLRATGARGRGDVEVVPTAAQALLALAVPVVATAASCGAKPGETVVLCAPTGERIKGFALDLLDRDRVVERLGRELSAESALAPRRATVPPDLVEQLARLRAVRKQIAEWSAGGERPTPEQEVAQVAAAERLRAALAAHFAALAPLLVRHDEADALVIDAELDGFESARAPFGTEAVMELGDPCPGCGMAFIPPSQLTVLKLIGA